MPSKSIEAWVVAALFPEDRAMETGIECYGDPESRLGQQAVRHRIQKKVRDYSNHCEEMERAWPRLTGSHGLSEAKRFETEFLSALPTA
jgi:hypothetical protein